MSPIEMPPSPPEPDVDIEARIARRLSRLRTEQSGRSRRSPSGPASAAPRCHGSSAPSSVRPRRCSAGCARSTGGRCRVSWPRRKRARRNLVPARDQAEWKDPASGYRRRIVSPPAPGLRGELVEVRMPPGASVSFDASPIAGSRAPPLDARRLAHARGRGVAVLAARRRLPSLRARRPDQFKNPGKREARYLVAMVRP